MVRKVISRTNFSTIEHIGLDRSPVRDFYHTLLKAAWPRFILLIVVGYLCVNALFALLYYVNPGSIANADPDSFLSCFAFSVQTIATIGYGVYSPATTAGHIIVVLESIAGLLYTALCTGLTFAKFARPSARIVFSRHPLLTTFEGEPALMFRMANARTNTVMSASVRVVALKSITTQEGYSMRRQYDLALVRDNSMVFVLPWTVIHKIDDKSPLCGMTDDDMKKADLSLFISMRGTDDIFSSEIHALHTYSYSQFRHATRFVDMMQGDNSQYRRVDHRLIHDYV